MSKRWIRLAVYLLIAMGVAWGAWWAYGWATMPVVTVTRVTEGPVVQAFYATGTVRPEREFPIKAAVAGTLEKVLVDRGDAVKAGQPLAIVNDPALKFAADRAKAMLEEKKKRADEKQSPVLGEFDARINAMEQMLATAQREVDRLDKLAATNAASSVDVDRARDVLQERTSLSESLKAQKIAKQYELQREVEVAQAEYEVALWDLEQQTLKSPIDGVVLDRPTSQGTRVAINDTLMRVADVRPANLVMRAAVDEEDVTQCRVGQTVRMSLYAFPGQRITGKIARIYDEADIDRRTFEVDVSFDDAAPQRDRLAAGMTGELAFIVAEKASATILPSTALQSGAVYVIEEGKLKKTSPQIGLKSFERVEVVSGVPTDARVVISPVGEIGEGRRVRTKEIDPEEAVGLLKEKQQTAAGAAFKGFN